MVYPKLSVERYKRIGICNGKRCRGQKHKSDAQLYRVADHRYRCAVCFRDERGSNP